MERQPLRADEPARDFAPGLPPESDLDISDKWILSRLAAVAAEATANMDRYELGLAAEKVETFIWENYCDWYIEICKSRLNGADPKQADTARRVLVWVLDKALRLLHPFMPFITEELWQALPGSGESLLLESWPAGLPAWEGDCADFDKVMDFIKAVRAMRSEMNVHPAKRAHLTIETASAEAFQKGAAALERFAFATGIELTGHYAGPAEGVVTVNTPHARGFIPLLDLIDREKELARLRRELEKNEKERAMFARQLENPGFVNKAPAQLVADTRAKLAAAEDKRRNIEQSLAALL